MQQVQARRHVSLVSEEDEEHYIEDVESEPPTPTPIHTASTTTTKVFSPPASAHLTKTVDTESGDGVEMVTLVNESANGSALKREELELEPGVNTDDHPVSLVFSNNGEMRIEDVSTPSPMPLLLKKETIESENTDQIEMKDMSSAQRDEDSAGPVSKEVWRTPSNGDNSMSSHAETSLQDHVPDLTGESRECSVAQISISSDNRTSEPSYVRNSEVDVEIPSDLSHNESEGVLEEEDGVEGVLEEEGEGEATPTQEDEEAEAHDEDVAGEEVVEMEEQGQTIEIEDDVSVRSAGEEVTPQATPTAGGPEYDEHGNELDEKGHPVIRHAFPDDWVLQPDQGDGIMRFEAEDGPVRFIINITEGGFKFPDPPNILNIATESYLKHIPTTFRLASGCELFVDTGNWRIQLESEIVDVLLRMDTGHELQNVTGETIWNTSKDITIENIERAMSIFSDCTLDSSPVRWFFNRDSTYNPKDARFRLEMDTEIENVIKSVSISDGMEIVETTSRVYIPDQSSTDVRNVRRFSLFDDTVLEDQGIRHLDSGGCTLAQTSNNFLLSEGGTLEDQGKRHLLSTDATLEDQGTRCLIAGDAERVDIVRGHDLYTDATITDIAREFAMCEDQERVDIKRHWLTMDQKIDRTLPRWNRAEFDSEVVDLKEMRLEMDMKIAETPSKFNLNQLEIDDDLLAEIEDDDE